MAAGTLGSRALSKGAPEPAPAAAGPDFAAVYEAHFRYVWRCLRSLGVRDSALDDAMQDVFLVVQRRLVEFDGRVELRTWLYAIALRVARKHWTRAQKDRARTEPSDTLSESALPVTDGEHVAERNERLSLARQALAALDDDKRVVFVLARIEQMSAPEIADVLSIPLNTVYSRLRVARETFEAEVRRLQLGGRPSHEE
jgi:RNA polymerase sigma-70 factor (ECF subfamily)